MGDREKDGLRQSLPRARLIIPSEAMETCGKSEIMSEGHPWWGLKG